MRLRRARATRRPQLRRFSWAAGGAGPGGRGGRGRRLLARAAEVPHAVAPAGRRCPSSAAHGGGGARARGPAGAPGAARSAREPPAGRDPGLEGEAGRRVSERAGGLARDGTREEGRGPRRCRPRPARWLRPPVSAARLQSVGRPTPGRGRGGLRAAPPPRPRPPRSPTAAHPWPRAARLAGPRLRTAGSRRPPGPFAAPGRPLPASPRSGPGGRLLGARGPRAPGPGAGLEVRRAFSPPGHLKTPPQQEDGGGDWPAPRRARGPAGWSRLLCPRGSLLEVRPGRTTRPAWSENPRWSCVAATRRACCRREEGPGRKGHSCSRERGRLPRETEWGSRYATGS